MTPKNKNSKNLKAISGKYAGEWACNRGKAEDKIKSKTRQISKRSRRDDSPEILVRVKTSDIPCRLPSGQVQETTIQSNPKQAEKI